jgi:hypothetical protein
MTGVRETMVSMTAEPSRFETEFPDLFALLSADRRASLSAALADDRLELGTVTRAQVALLVQSITDDMTDAAYLDAVLQLTAPRAAHAG